MLMSRSLPPSGAATVSRLSVYIASKRSRTRSPTAVRSAGEANGAMVPLTTVRSSAYSNARSLVDFAFVRSEPIV